MDINCNHFSHQMVYVHSTIPQLTLLYECFLGHIEVFKIQTNVENLRNLSLAYLYLRC
jgi:hypothetical protein